MIMRLIIMFLLIVPSWVGAEKFICVTEQSVGFKFQNDQWKSVTFKPVDKFIVDTERKRVENFGDNNPLFIDCEDDILSISCNMNGWYQGPIGFDMGKRSLRFIASYVDNTFVLDVGNTYPASLSIGSCSKF